MRLEPVEIVAILKSTPDQAFNAFTDKISEWWPVHSHSVGANIDKSPPEFVVIENMSAGIFMKFHQPELNGSGAILLIGFPEN